MRRSVCLSFLIALVFLLALPACNENKAGKPPGGVNDNKKWRDEPVWVVNHGDSTNADFRVDPGVKVTTADQDLTFKSQECTMLTVSPGTRPQDANLFTAAGPSNTVTIHINKQATPGTYQYQVDCQDSAGHHPTVHGNSPPIIIVDQ